MKKILLNTLVLMSAGAAMAQPVKKIPQPVSSLKNYNDSLSCAVGMSIAQGLTQQGIKKVNTAVMQQGMDAVFTKKTLLLDANQCRSVVMNFMQQQKAGGAKSVKPKAPVITKGLLKTQIDSMSYAAGVDIANNIQQQQLTGIKTGLLTKAIAAVQAKKPAGLSQDLANTIVQKHMQTLYEKLQAASMGKVNEEKARGAAFLEANKKREGVQVTASGLQYEVVKSGDTSKPSPKLNDQIVAHYAGRTIDGKEDFDNSYKRGQPLTIGVSSVIPGWTEALQLMHPGDKWKVYIPSELGYGDRGAGAGIPGGATLIFEMELLEVLK